MYQDEVEVDQSLNDEEHKCQKQSKDSMSDIATNSHIHDSYDDLNKNQY